MTEGGTVTVRTPRAQTEPTLYEDAAAGAAPQPAAASPSAEEATAPRARRRGVPARVQIMAWVVLLMAIVLLTVVVVVRNLLLQQADESVTASLQREVDEFAQFARTGADPATSEPIGSAFELVERHLQRQYPDGDQVLVGWANASSPQPEVLYQQREAPLALHEERQRHILDPILDSADTSGAVDTDAGELRWAKITVTGPGGAQDRAVLVVGQLVDRDRAEIASTVNTLVLVSLGGLLLAGFAAWMVAGQILAPVRLLRHAAASISDKDLTARIEVEGRDDITALAEQFNAMLDRLESAFAVQRQFVDDASHELRTPITIVRGNLEIMESVTDHPAERAEIIRLCTDELDRMNRIVADLLVLATSDRPDFVRPEPVELAELTSDLFAKVRALGDRRWRLEAIGEGEVRIDPQRVTQAVLQLADNAVRHTRPGDEISLGSASIDGTASFWISDTGPGVPPEEAATIFERFHRGSGTAAGAGGAGLGLAIVTAIAEAHGGSVQLLSAPGEGATFGIELPTPGWERR